MTIPGPTHRQHQRTLEFDVDKQRLTRNRECDFSGIVAGSVGYLRAKFNFPIRGWHGCTKAASFWVEDKEYAVLLDDENSCMIPSEALKGDKFSVSVMGAKTGYKIETNKVKVRQEVIK